MGFAGSGVGGARLPRIGTFRGSALLTILKNKIHIKQSGFAGQSIILKN